jgi:hypothetical protein
MTAAVLIVLVLAGMIAIGFHPVAAGAALAIVALVAILSVANMARQHRQ